MLHVVSFDVDQLGRLPTTPLMTPIPLETMVSGILGRHHRPIALAHVWRHLKPLHLRYPHLCLLLDLVF